jgi:hypothetical protein
MTPLATPPNDRSRAVVCTVPRTTVTGLAQTAAARLKGICPRIVGDLKTPATRVAVLAGETDPTPALAAVLSDSRIDGVIAGASGVVDEVDGAIGYFQDVIGSGRSIALLAVGYGASHDPGVAEMARWLKGVLPDQPVEHWPLPNPSWMPR